MKQLISLSSLLFVLLLLNQSCTKQSPDKMETITTPLQSLKATVSANNPYVLNVNDMGSVSIRRQAAHFTVSQTEADSKDGKLLYKYIPQNDYTGTDEVELVSTKTSFTPGNGCNSGGQVTTYHSNIVIQFTVIQ